MPQFGNKPESGPSYCALIGDVVKSRQIENRSAFQGRFQEMISRLNQEHESALASPLELSSGDEVQGLFQKPEAIVPVVVRLADDLFPYRIAFGLGYGRIATEILPHTYQIDGPCFHHARSALGRSQKEDAWMVAEGFGDPADRVLSVLFLLMHAVRSRWTPTQVEYIRRARSMLQKEVAEKLAKSPSAVSESLQAASFEAVHQAESAAEALLALFQ